MKMNYYYLHFFLIGILCIFVSGTFSDEPTMLGMIRKECNFSGFSNDSEILGNRPEFKECQDWNSITSIKSVKQFTADNMGNIRCLLYYESLVSACKNVSTAAKLYELLKASPPTTFMQDFCDNLLSLLKKQSESQTMHNVIKNKEQCEFLCSDYHNGNRVLKEMCIKSYDFQNLQLEKEKSQIPLGASTNTELENKKKPNDGELTSTIKVKSDQLPLNPDTNQNQFRTNVVKKPETVKGGSIVSGQHVAIQGDTLFGEADQNLASKPKLAGDTLFGEADQNLASKPKLAGDEISEKNKDNQGDTISETPVKNPDKVLKVQADSLAPHNIDISSKIKSSTIANAQIPKVIVQDEKPKTDSDPDNTELDNELQAPPKVKDQNTAPGDDYDVEQENLEQNNEPKQVDAVAEADPDAMPDSYKMPKVSQLSDRLGYDDDINGNSNFFTYFSFTCVIFIIGYVFYHNKTKILALLVEGRHSRRTQRARRPNIANYQKLDSNLEEAISSSVSKNPSHVIY